MGSAQLAALPILNPGGQAVPLSSIADVYITKGSPDLNRENQRLMASVKSRLESLDLRTAIREVRAKLADLPLPPGYSIEYGGLYKSQQETFNSLVMVLLVTILLALSVLVLTFRSFRAAISLLATAVLSLTG